MVLVLDDTEVASWPLALPPRPDLGVVDELARLQLAARRVGYSIRLRHACPELAELLALSGLAHVVGAETTPGPPP